MRSKKCSVILAGLALLSSAVHLYATDIFTMDGAFDSDAYTVISYNMKIAAAVNGPHLYLATWGAGEGGNDHVLYVAPELGDGTSDPIPGWNKTGVVFFTTASYPFMVAEGDNGYNTWYNGGTGCRITNVNGGALEGVINMTNVFGYIPEAIYVAAVAFGSADGGGIVSQSPYNWSDTSSLILNIEEFQRINIASIRDNGANGIYDIGTPTMQTVVDGNSQDANYGLRRFFINEPANDQYNITVNLQPNAGTNTITDVELFSNLNRRDFAVMPGDESPSSVTTNSDSTYYRAYPMAKLSNGYYSITVPAYRCGAYRINARYKVNGDDYVYYTDHAQRRDCAVVISPKKALEVTMYEINPMTAEATNNQFAGRSTFRDMYTVNTNRPDRINASYFNNLGINMIWLQPIHPIGYVGRDIDPLTGSDFDPGSPYAVRNYWRVNGVLGDPWSDEYNNAGMSEFTNFVAAYDAAGIGVMLDGTFNHSAWDCQIGEVGVEMFDWATNATDYICNIRPQWYSSTSNYGNHASYYHATNNTDIGVAPDRIDFGKWKDAVEFNYGTYDCLVQGQAQGFENTSYSRWYERYKLEEDRMDDLDAYQKEVWEYFSYYPIYWLEKTGHPAGTPKSESYKGIDGLRCDFAQGLPSAFWEYTINKTRTVKWDFLFMAESLDGYTTAGNSQQHGIGYRSSRHFDILNENFVFQWRNEFFKEFPGGNKATSTITPNRSTSLIQSQFAIRKAAFANAPLLLNLTCHDEVIPTAHQPSLLNAYAALSSLSGSPMVMYGQESGMQNDYDTYASEYTYMGCTLDPANNFELYESNFGKSIPNFKRYNCMTSVWYQGSTWMPQLCAAYGRVGKARLNSPALQSINDYFLCITNSTAKDENIFALAKYEAAGVSAASQDVVFVFVNNDCQAHTNTAACYEVDVDYSGKNWFGIESSHSYNVVDLVSTNPTKFLWSSNKTGASILTEGLYVGLNGDPWQGQHAQFLKLIDVAATYPTNAQGQYAGSKYSDWDRDDDGMNNDWENTYGLNPDSAVGVNGASGDLDGDGMSNYTEFQAGTAPNSASDALVIDELKLEGSSLSITWASKPNKNYQILYKYSLLDSDEPWEPYGPLRTALSTDTTVTGAAGADDTNRYFRVRVRP